MNVLVTGVSGFLGGALARHLSARGDLVATVPGRRDVERIDTLAGDVPIDALVHAGFSVDYRAAEPGAPESENVLSTRRVLAWAAARRVPHVVFLSAAAVLGVSATPRARNEDDAGATDPPFAAYRATRYVADKLACEELLAAYPGAATTLYVTTVYGAGMPRETRAALGKLRGVFPLVLVPPGGTSWLALEDFLRAVEIVLEKSPGIPLVVSGGNTTYAALYATAAEILGVGWRKRILALPSAARRLADAAGGRFLSAAVLQSAFGFKYYSAERARRTIGWTPRATLASALRPALGP